MNNKRKWIIILSSIPLLVSIGRAIFCLIRYDYSLTTAMSDVLELNIAFSGASLVAAVLFSSKKFQKWLNTFAYEEDEEDEITDESRVTAIEILLAVAILVVVVGTVVFLWKATSNHKAESVDNAGYIDMQDDEAAADAPLGVEYTDAGWFYYSETGKSLGPFQYIFREDLDFELDDICRYIDENGLYGYFDRDGKIITEAIFQQAAKFEEGTAKVQKEKDKIYYIDEKGEAITKEYKDGSAAFEMQGGYCRVQTFDDKWAIINRDDEIILSGCDSIELLPMVTTFGSAVIDHHAVLFELNSIDGDEFRIIKEYSEFNKISEVKLGAFAFVWNADGHVGVVDSLGDVIIEPIYDNIEYKIIEHNYGGDDFSLNNILFLALDQEGITHTIKVE